MRIFLTTAVGLLMLHCGQAPPETQVEKPAAEEYFDLDGDLAGSHILVSWKGLQGAPKDLTRTKTQAWEKATQLLSRLKEDPAAFEKVAMLESDGPSGARGGSLGSWSTGAMAAGFDEALKKLEIGQICDEPVETIFGYHIIRRNPMRVKHFGGYGFFVAFAGHSRTPAKITRTKEEARAIAADLQDEVNEENFDAMATIHNDLGEGPVFLGVLNEGFPTDPDTLKQFSELQIGEVGGPIEFPMGFAFLKRSKLVRLAGSHVIIAYDGAERAASHVVRSKEEARQLADRLIGEIQAGTTTLDEAAREHSDGPTATKGGDLGDWFKGYMFPAFDQVVEQLEVGEVNSEPLETNLGFHIIKRNPLLKDSEKTLPE